MATLQRNISAIREMTFEEMDLVGGGSATFVEEQIWTECAVKYVDEIGFENTIIVTDDNGMIVTSVDYYYHP